MELWCLANTVLKRISGMPQVTKREETDPGVGEYPFRHI